MNPVQLESLPCPLNCPENDEVVLRGRDRLHSLPGEFTVVKCCTCGLMRTNPRPTAESIGFYYPDNYGPYLGTQVEQLRPDQSRGIKNVLRPLVRRIFDSKSEALPDVRPGHLLEIGCTSGSFLHRMATGGWKVEGIEFSEKAAKAASKLGYEVHNGSLENAPEPTYPFDLIVGWMVLEHLHNPVRSLKKLHAWANPGASLVLSVPNADTLAFRISKENWYDLHLPNHLYHFTPETLAKVLEAGGWQLEKIQHQRTVNNLIESAAYHFESKGWHRLSNWLHEHAARGGKWFYFQFPVAWALSVFGQSGRMTVWARKLGEVDLPSGQKSSGVTARKIGI